MSVEELLFWFVGVPATAYALGVAWLRWTMKKIAERQLGFLREGTISKFLVYAANLSTPTLFGLVALTMVLTASEDPTVESLLRLAGTTYALASILTVLSQAWIVVRRKAMAYREYFTRVLVMIALPETIVIYVLLVVILVASWATAAIPPIQPADADSVVRALQYMMIGTISAPLEAIIASRAPNLEGRGFTMGLVTMVPAELPILLALVLALQQLGPL